ncbi:helix-turn-helix transcriptional regulator [Motilibacter deserti]|uniref:Response regulator transcription factor n=1 Tax=Motilibacter deserti TaxID=2714956 RepID=A0ABX0GVR5_9ACTN|nr:LuxR C-terminal-related transcriptional regulator [Motilibacter deserti]NHC13815.1 response regulator transcription factor [Motilibacter deserti]
MSGQVSVYVQAEDQVSRYGLVGQLAGRPDMVLVDAARLPEVPAAATVVAVLAVDEVDEACVALVRTMRARGHQVVVVASRLEESSVIRAAEAGAGSLVRRSDVTPQALALAIGAAAKGECRVPDDIVGRLLRHVGQLQRQVLTPRGVRLNGFSDREVAVLAMLADGFDTTEIAVRLSYSERTVKSIIHDVTSRLQLRNRSHAVAYAVREGLI